MEKDAQCGGETLRFGRAARIELARGLHQETDLLGELVLEVGAVAIYSRRLGWARHLACISRSQKGCWNSSFSPICLGRSLFSRFGWRWTGRRRRRTLRPIRTNARAIPYGGDGR